MGRGKVAIERIENKVTRQVTFSKRKNGLMKKATELSVLCEVDVALIMFSSTGKLYEHGNPDNNKKILEKYHKRCYNPGKSNTNTPDEMQIEEMTKLRAEYESLQRSNSNFLGKELESLNIKELENLEKQIDKTLSQTRQRESEIMYQKIEDLSKLEQELEDQNAQLLSQLEGGQPSMEQDDDDSLNELDIIRWLDNEEEADDGYWLDNEEEADDGYRLDNEEEADDGSRE